MLRAVLVLAMLVVGFTNLVVGLGPSTAVVLGYLAVVLIVSFVAPGASRVLAAGGLGLALGFAILAGRVSDDCGERQPPADGIYVPVLSEVAHVSWCSDQARRRLDLGTVITGGVGCAGLVSLVLAGRRRRDSNRIAR